MIPCQTLKKPSVSPAWSGRRLCLKRANIRFRPPRKNILISCSNAWSTADSALFPNILAITIGANIGEQSFEIIPNGDMAQYSVIDPTEPLLATDLTVNYTVPGFKLKDTMYDPNDKISGYEYAADNGKRYYIDRCQSASVIHINNEGSGFSSFEHNGITFVYYPADNGYIGLMWNYSGYVYSVDGQISLDEALKVADSINY